jgi:beta-mannan synthase
MGRDLIRDGSGQDDDAAAATPVVALLQLCVDVCIAMVLMMFTERLFMGILSIYYRFIAKPPHKRYRWAPVHEAQPQSTTHDHDSEALLTPARSYPKVLVQIPMYNEREVLRNKQTRDAFYPTYERYNG